MILQELQEQALQLSLKERWQLVQQLLASIQQETLPSTFSQLPDELFPLIQYRLGSSGQSIAIIKNTGIRVQTLVVASTHWAWELGKIAEEYSLSETQVAEALKFYEAHKAEIDGEIASELALEANHV